MDEAGQRNFSKALNVAKQIFNSLTEYIQVTFFFISFLPFKKFDTYFRANKLTSLILGL